MSSIRLSGIVNDSITDGAGIRFTIFTQGCPHHCEECHNPQTWSFDGGKLYDIDDLMTQILDNPLLTGVTFSGGEPLVRAGELLPLAEKIKKNKLELAIYSGFTFEKLLEDSNADIIRLLKLADILVDGKFEKKLKSYTLKFCGSSNQRVIDLKKSFRQNKVVLEKSGRWT